MMEALVREMQDPEAGVPVRSQKIFLTSVPSAFMGYDLIGWLMDRLAIEESEALNLGNQLCQYGYFFPVSDNKNLVIKDDSSLYRFQSPYYWPWQHRGGTSGVGGSSLGGAGGAPPSAASSGTTAATGPSQTPQPTHPDNVEYAIYLCKRTKRNKQRHVLEEYEAEALAGLRKNLQAKWEFITMHANEQVKLAKERKKGDKIVSDSQERAYWRVYRPPPGVSSALEPCPIPGRCRNGPRSRRRELEHCKKEVEFLRNCLTRTRVKMSVALDSMVQHAETFAEYDPLICPAQPSNPWVTEDLTYWQMNNQIVEIPTEKRVRRWGLSMEELVSDPTGLQEFTAYLRKEYSHENIRFWMAATDLRRSSQSQIQHKVNEIYEEFLAAGAPCEINIDGKTMERVQQELKIPSRFTFDAAADHVYALLLKKDCYPRFVRSEHYKSLIAAGKQPLHKKRFFGFGGPTKKKSSTTAPPTAALLQQSGAGGSVSGTGASSSSGAAPLNRRRGSDRSLSGSAHELAVSGVRDAHHHHHQKVPHSHSQSNLSDIPYRPEAGAPAAGEDSGGAVCPWDVPGPERLEPTPRSRNNSAIDSCSSSSDISVAIVEVSERLRRSCGLPQQSTLDERRVPPPVRRLSAFEPRRGPAPGAPGFRDEFPHRSFDSSSAASSFAGDAGSEADTAPDPRVELCKRSPGLLKSLSVSSAAAMVAPVISVSSAADDFPPDSADTKRRIGAGGGSDTPPAEGEGGADETTESPSAGGTASSLSISLAPSPLSPSAPPQAPPPLLEVDEAVAEIREEDDRSEPPLSSISRPTVLPETIQTSRNAKRESDDASSSASNAVVPQTESEPDHSERVADAAGRSPLSAVQSQPLAVAPLAESEDAAEEEEEGSEEVEPIVAVAVGETLADRPPRPSPDKDDKGNDICPWEDEETCKMDTPFVKTYATLGYL